MLRVVATTSHHDKLAIYIAIIQVTCLPIVVSIDSDMSTYVCMLLSYRLVRGPSPRVNAARCE